MKQIMAQITKNTASKGKKNKNNLQWIEWNLLHSSPQFDVGARFFLDLL
jgi:hypothetical protein